MAEPDDQSPADRQVVSDAARVSLWQAVNALALTWVRMPLVQRFAAALPRNAGQRNSGIAGRLQTMQAGSGAISQYPLRLTRTVQFMRNMPDPFTQAQPTPQQWDAWLDTTRRVEMAHRLTAAWLRSRMPGYPILPAPQLAAGAPLTADESDYKLIWTRGEIAQGLQFQNPPERIGQFLEATPAEQRNLIDGTRAVALALERSSEWARLGAATAALSDSARADLRQARETVARRLSREEVDAYSRVTLARFNYRVAVLNEVLSTLSGSGQEYAATFGTANELLETAGSDVFGELTAYGPPISMSRPQDIDLRPGSFQLVSFTRTITEDAESSGILDLGQMLWLKDPLVPDAVRLIGGTVSVGQLSDRERWTGIVLAGTADAWSP